MEQRELEARGLRFTVRVGGPPHGPAVVLLHGFPQDAREWDLIVGGLHDAGLRTFAMDQRGYTASARPAKTADYRIGECVADVVAVLDTLGLAEAHVVGHDWGASVAWHLAAGHPDRVTTLTAVSVPHPAAVAWAVRRHPTQLLRFLYVALLRRPGLAERLLLARDGAVLRRMMRPIGPGRASAYAEAMRQPGRLTGALRWYRAMSPRDGRAAAVRVPTTYVWSDGDIAISRHAALRCRDFVLADYRFVVLPGVSHWVPEQAPDALTDVLMHRIGVAGTGPVSGASAG